MTFAQLYYYTCPDEVVKEIDPEERNKCLEWQFKFMAEGQKLMERRRKGL